MTFRSLQIWNFALFLALATSSLTQAYTLNGELKQWHRVTITFDGPDSSEDAKANPFLDYRLNVTFKNNNSAFTVPGFYAADVEAAETSAIQGNKWRVHFMPEMAGAWTFEASFRTGKSVAISDDVSAGKATSFDGTKGRFKIEPTDKSMPDMRAQGKLAYVGKHYLQFQETGQYYLKSGPDSPGTFLAYKGFDGTYSHNPKKQLLKDWVPHIQDWKEGDRERSTP